MRQRVGVLGGTFDPPHIGHLLLAAEAKQQYQLDYVYLIPTANPYMKDPPWASAPNRMQMTRCATHGRSWLVASDCDIVRGGPTYTIDTLADLGAASRRSYNTWDLFLIVGQDCDISQWKCADVIAERCTIAKLDRITDISSTMIRERVLHQLPIDGLVSDDVRRFIAQNMLYRHAPVSQAKETSTAREVSAAPPGGEAGEVGRDDTGRPETLADGETTGNVTGAYRFDAECWRCGRPQSEHIHGLCRRKRDA